MSISLQQYGPNLVSPVPMPEALDYCRRLARSHYENFALASLLVPGRMRQHIYNLYAFCRWADDLGDEVGEPARSLELLDWWGNELEACFAGRAVHPVYVALSRTIAEFELPIHPFRDLISAFRQDQTVTRYGTYGQLLDYCRRSANPVGRLYLRMFGYQDEERTRLSDCTCTALQLANFWQDVARDLAKGRIYLPLEDMERFGYSEAELLAGECNQQFVCLMRFEVERTRELFAEGLPLARMVNRRVRRDIQLFSQGGLAVLDLIERQGYDTLSRRPALSRARKLGLFVRRLLPW